MPILKDPPPKKNFENMGKEKKCCILSFSTLFSILQNPISTVWSH